MDNILKLCDKQRKLKRKKNTTGCAKPYREVNQQVEAAVKSPKKGKSVGLDNIPSELVQAGGEANDRYVTHHLQ